MQERPLRKNMRYYKQHNADFVDKKRPFAFRIKGEPPVLTPNQTRTARSGLKSNKNGPFSFRFKEERPVLVSNQTRTARSYFESNKNRPFSFRIKQEPPVLISPNPFSSKCSRPGHPKDASLEVVVGVDSRMHPQDRPACRFLCCYILICCFGPSGSFWVAVLFVSFVPKASKSAGVDTATFRDAWLKRMLPVLREDEETFRNG